MRSWRDRRAVVRCVGVDGLVAAVSALLARPSLTLLLSVARPRAGRSDLRFGWPTGVTKQATRMRVLYTWTGVAALALGVVVWGLIFWCCIRYRKRSDELPRQTKYNFLVEIVCFDLPVHRHRRPVLPHGGRRGRRQQAHQEPRRPGPGRRVQVELAVRVPLLPGVGGATKTGTGDDAQAYADAAGKPSTDPQPRRGPLVPTLEHGRLLERDPGPGAAGRARRCGRRALLGRHPLVLGAGVPVQARRHPVRHRPRQHPRGTTSSSSPRRRPAASSAAAPNCAARTTRR